MAIPQFIPGSLFLFSLISVSLGVDLDPHQLWEAPGFPAGMVTSVAAKADGTVFAAIRSKGVYMFDFSRPAEPIRLGRLGNFSSPTQLLLRGESLYVSDSLTGLDVYDVSKRGSPVRLGGAPITNIVNFCMTTNLALLACDAPGLRLVDFSSPLNPVLLGSLTTSPAVSVAGEGNLAVIAAKGGGAVIVDISNPSSPRKVGSYSYTNGVNACQWVAMRGNRVFDADLFAGLISIDITDPTKPKELERIKVPGGTIRGVTTVSDFAYVAWETSSSNSFYTALSYDLTDPAGLKQTGTILADSFVTEFSAAGDRLYVAQNGEGIGIYDNSVAGHPALLRRFGSYMAPRNVHVSEGLAFVSSTFGRFDIFDLGDPTEPRWISGLTMRSPVDAAASGNVAAICVDQGLQLLDISDPSNPIRKGFFTNACEGVALSGKYAFLASKGGGIVVVDISTPENPVRAGGLFRSGQGHALRLVGDRCYVANRFSLEILDVSNPAMPVALGRLALPNWVFDVAISGKYAYVADGPGGLKVIDVNNATNPVVVAEVSTKSDTQSVEVIGNYVCVSTVRHGVQIFDITDPIHPTLAGCYRNLTSEQPHGLCVVGNNLLVADYGRGVVALDLTVSRAKRANGFYEYGNLFYDVKAGESFVLGADSGKMRVFSPGLNMQLLATFPTASTCAGIAIDGPYAYLAVQGAGVQIVDLTDPAQPQEIKTVNTPGEAYDVCVNGQVAWVADGSAGIRALNVAVKSNAVSIASLDTVGTSLGVTLEGTNLFVCDGPNGLLIFDVKNPAQILPVGSYNSPGTAYKIALKEGYGYLADGTNGMEVIDVSNRSNPKRMQGVYTGGDCRAAVAYGDLLYVSDANNGVSLWDLRAPALPTRVAGNSVMEAWAIRPTPLGAYVASYTGGMHLLETFTLKKPDGLQIDFSSADFRRRRFRLIGQGTFGDVAVEVQRVLDGFNWKAWRRITLPQWGAVLEDTEFSESQAYYRAVSP
jgi:hypothetical protein